MIEDAGGHQRQEDDPVQGYEAAGHRRGSGMAPAQDFERRPDQDRQRRYVGRDVGDQLGAREREEEERRCEPDPQEEPEGAGEQSLIRCTMPPLPMRPLKLRLVEEAQTSPSARMPLLMPRQAPQVGLVTQKPLSMKILMRPSSRACE